MSSQRSNDLNNEIIERLGLSPRELRDRAIEFEAEAVTGDVQAMIATGFAYYFGVGVPRNLEVGLDWLEQAVALGEPNAAWVLGWLLIQYENQASRGTQLLESAVSSGIQDAGPILARVLKDGLGVAHDLPRAAKLFEKACCKGDVESCLEAGSLYRSLGDRTSARRCFLNAAEFGDLDAQEVYGEMLVAEGRNSEEIEKGVSWLRAASLAGRRRAKYMLAVVAARGTVGPRDIVEAVRLCREAADAGEASAQYMLSLMYERGDGIPKDTALARTLLEQAAVNGSIKARERLARLEAPGE